MRYLFKNLKSFIKTEKMIFLLVLLCIVTSSFIINFSYGLYQNYNVVKKEETSDLTEMVITINNPDDVTKQKLKECIFSISDSTNSSMKMYVASPIIEPFYSKQNDPDQPWNAIMMYFVAENGRIKHSASFEENLKNNGNLVSGEYFNDAQETNGDKVAIVRIIEDGQMDLGCTKEITTRVEGEKRWVQIQNKEYEVIGYHKQLATPFFPFESLDEETTFQNWIGIVFKDSMTISEYQDIKNNFESIFGNSVSVPELDIPESENYYLYNTITAISVLIALLAAINFSVLYKYILSKRTKTLAIFQLCGCTRSKILFLFISECMLIAIPLFTLTTVFYDKVVLPYLSKYFEYIEGAYNIKLYLLIFAIYIFSTIFVLLIMILRFLRKTINEARREN